MPPDKGNFIPTEDSAVKQIQSLHRDNIARITAMEGQLTQLQSDIGEILHWVRNAKMGMKFFAKSSSWMGTTLIWVAKVLGAVMLIYALYLAYREGRSPHDIKFIP